jgi:succinate-semialdehyde dehydrogenase/glutarate-semialdehyde dehydrogenase
MNTGQETPVGSIQITNKYTGEELDTILADTAGSLREKIEHAHENASALTSMAFEERVEWLGRIASELQSKKKDVKKMIVAEGGLPIKYSEWELSIVSDGFKHSDFYLQFVEDRPLQSPDGQQHSRIVHIPQGMSACIAPRNSPLSLPLYMLGANYLVGNPAIVKPSTACPLSMIHVLDMMQEMGVPAIDAFNLCIAPGDWVIGEFIQNQLLKVILSISSSHTAKDIIVQYAKYLKNSIDKSMGLNMYTMPFKHFVFECAGNDAGIVMNDVNIEKVAEWNVKASFTNGGQQCFSMKRIIVHQDIYDQYVESLAREIGKLKVGDPMDPAVDVGPLGSRKILAMMRVMVGDAKERGCKVIAGEQEIDTGYDYGLFYYPTLVEIPPELVGDLPKAPFLFREEAFGPVRSITKAESLEDAIRLANLSNYGMRAAVYTSSEENIAAFKKELDVANLYINAQPLMTDISVMLGGVKDSAYPPGAKYYAQELVHQKYIFDGSPENLDLIR